MSAASLNARLFAPVGRHLRQADWPVAALILVAVLSGARFGGARSYAYWHPWLTQFTVLLGAYGFASCARILLQSVCFDRSAACWTAALAAIVIGWMLVLPLMHFLIFAGVPSFTNILYLDIAAFATALLIIPAEVEAERARLTRRAAEREAVRDREQALARELLEARLAALQGQIEPHFIYNTLANVRALVRQDADAAERMLTHLIGFLRSAMPDLRGQGTPLGQELDRVEAYLGIIGMRMGERLHFSIAASDEARACQVPPLSVMTLVENAIQHGIEPKVDGGTLHVRAGCTEGRLRIDVDDDGAGFQSETGGGVGLVNLQERLATLFGDAAALSLAPRDGGGLAATIALPARRGALA